MTRKKDSLGRPLRRYRNVEGFIGTRHGKLTVLRLAGVNKHRSVQVLCLCDCGKRKVIVKRNLEIGKTKSCGCASREMISQASRTHGMSDSPTYEVWEHVVDRTCNPNNDRYHDYGGRGIKLCRRWRKFENFLADLGERGEGQSIGRLDNDKGYNPANCEWQDSHKQARNRRDNVLINYNGKTQCLADWAKETGINYATLRYRVKKGWPARHALTRPPSSRGPRPRFGTSGEG